MKNFTIGNVFSNPIYDPFTHHNMKGLLDVHRDNMSSLILVMFYSDLLQEVNKVF